MNLIKEKDALLDWIKAIKENNPNEVENYEMIEVINDKIREIENKIKKEKKI